MPKVELHVHLEGSIRPETVLQLAAKNGVSLPANDLVGLKEWYRFQNFPHFVKIYVGVSDCIRSTEDIEFIAKEFLLGQATQNILYSEVTYTACTIEKRCGIPVDEQLDALRSALDWGKKALDVEAQFVLDIVRGDTPERAAQVLDWVSDNLGKGVCALGLAGFESLGTKVFADVFGEAKRRGVPVTAHAGETEGAWSIQETWELTGAPRIGHGVRILEDPELVSEFIRQGMVLEVCPTSNVCLGVFPSLEMHTLPELMEAGLAVTLNSDDPPMFGTTLTDEWIRCSEVFDWDDEVAQQLTEAAIDASFLPDSAKQALRSKVAHSTIGA